MIKKLSCQFLWKMRQYGWVLIKWHYFFDRDEKTVRKHVNNVFKENELDKENNTQKMRVDGCKRIAASIFLEFLGRNDALFRNEEKVISDGALVAITLMIAESKPEEKDIMTTLVMNLLKI